MVINGGYIVANSPDYHYLVGGFNRAQWMHSFHRLKKG